MVALLLPTTRSNRRVHSGFYLLLGFSYSVYEWILYAKNHKLQLSIRQKAVLITTNFMFYTLPYRSFSISWPLAGNHLFTFINRLVSRSSFCRSSMRSFSCSCVGSMSLMRTLLYVATPIGVLIPRNDH